MVILYAYDKRPVIRHRKCNLISSGATKDIFTCCGIYGVKPGYTPNSPCAHLSCIFIACITVWSVMIHGIEDMTHLFLCFPGFSKIGIHICNMVAGLISMGILTDESTDIR